MTSLPVVLVLAGGRGTRMGGVDKALVELGGRTLLAHVLDRVTGQGSTVVLNANGDPTRYARFGLPVLADPLPGRPGPLAGVLAGLEWMRDHALQAEDLLTVPCDTPFLPRDLAARLAAARAAEHAVLACGSSAGRRHHVIGLWPVRLAAALRTALIAEGVRRVEAFTNRHTCACAVYGMDPVDPFANLNTPEELASAEGR